MPVHDDEWPGDPGHGAVPDGEGGLGFGGGHSELISSAIRRREARGGVVDVLGGPAAHLAEVGQDARGGDVGDGDAALERGAHRSAGLVDDAQHGQQPGWWAGRVEVVERGLLEQVLAQGLPDAQGDPLFGGQCFDAEQRHHLLQGAFVLQGC